MNRFATTAVVATAALFAADSAQAASTTTYFGGHAGQANSHSFTTSDGVGITATATTTAPGNAKVGQYSKGLGVTSCEPLHPWFPVNIDSHLLDGKKSNETVWLSFDQEFKLEGLLFSYVDCNDDVKLYDETNSFLGSFSLSPNQGGYDYLDLSGLNLSTNKIGIMAYGNDDGVKVKGVRGHAVPTPTAALAGIGGLIALAARRRRPAAE